MRLRALIVSLLFATAAFAGTWNESNPRDFTPNFDRATHMILSPERPLTPEDRVQLRARGVEVQAPLSEGRYLARVVDATLAAADERIVSLEPLTTHHKILRSALRGAATGRPWADVTVIFHKDVSFEDARTSIAAAGGSLDDVFAVGFGPSRRVEARIARAGLDALASDERVLAIGGRPRLGAIPHNIRAGQLSHVPEVHAAPYNLSGAGQVVMVSELDEAEATHREFDVRLVVAKGSGNGSHATHVSGTIGASGVRVDARGMAPKVTIHQFDVGSSVASHLRLLDEEIAKLQPIANNTSLGFPLGWCEQCPTPDGLVVWNDEEEYYGAYEAGYGTPAYDDITLETGTLLIFSAGNDGNLPPLAGFGEHHHVDPQTGDPTTKKFCFSVLGTGSDCPTSCDGGCETTKHHSITPFDTMTVTGAGKNVLAVGAVNTFPAPATIAAFSSRGPAKDGRVKPDVVAKGVSVLSTVPPNSYAALQGTSMSAPVVTGITALIAEQWQKTFGSRGKPAELKAVIIAGATDIGNPGPDYTHGFGLIDAKNSVDLIISDGGTRSQIKTVSIGQGARHETLINLAAAQNLRVVAAWPDPSVILLGNDSISAKALVNDLDLFVIDPSGNTHRPYVLDKSKHEEPATRGVNNTDNAEMVDIANAPAGNYRVVVEGSRVTEGPQDVVILANAKGTSVVPCKDLQEPNDTAATAYGNVPPGQTISAGICAEGDVDFLKFVASRFGPITATITAADVPLRLTLTAANGQTGTVEVPAKSTRSVTLQYGIGNAQAPDLAVTAKIEATAPLSGLDSRYTVKLDFGQFAPPRRRSVR